MDVLTLLIVLLVCAAIFAYSIIANYRLKQLSCATNASPLYTFINQLAHTWTFGLYGFLFGNEHKNKRFTTVDAANAKAA